MNAEQLRWFYRTSAPAEVSVKMQPVPSSSKTGVFKLWSWDPQSQRATSGSIEKRRKKK